ncbi:MAG: FlxA-like family protein [Magnetospirillum sp.]|nr:FlxA-like family protein [Magnetospirillum sp.]
MRNLDSTTRARVKLAASSLILGSALAMPAFAQSADPQTLQTQIQDLQKQLDQVKADQAKTKAIADKAAQGQTSDGKNFLTNSAVKVTLGGFIENTAIYRTRFEGSDVGSGYNVGGALGGPGGNIPYRNLPQYYTGEFRDTARQSRLSLLVQGQEDYSSLAAYYEMDFLGIGTGSNYKESNSYVPRVRHLYTTYDDDKDGWHFLAGQTWSLLTLDRVGITPRSEITPLTIDAQYATGFTWTRQPQVRLVKDWNKTLWAGIAIESPQTTMGGANAYANNSTLTLPDGRQVHINNASCINNGQNDSGCGLAGYGEPNLSLDQIPDITAKVAADTSFGHYEAYGVARFFNSQVYDTAGNSNYTTMGGGFGADALIPVVPKYLEFQASGLVGRGIGRYGTSQLPDVTVDPTTGKLTPIPEAQVLLGLVGHPNDLWDIYGYAGMEAAAATDNGTAGNGWGTPTNAAMAGCYTEGVACSVNAQAVRQINVGAWYSAYKGKYGAMKIGIEDSETWVKPFGLQTVEDNIAMFSVRYFPF